MAPINSLGKDDPNEVKQDPFHIVMPLALQMVPFNSLSQDDQKEVQYASFIMWCYWHQHHMILTLL